jgi:hypothetical protein
MAITIQISKKRRRRRLEEGADLSSIAVRYSRSEVSQN